MGSVLWLLSIILKLIVIIDRVALPTHLLLMSLCPWIIRVTAVPVWIFKNLTDHKRWLYQAAWTWRMHIVWGNQWMKERNILEETCVIVCLHWCMITTIIWYYDISHAWALVEIIWGARGISKYYGPLL